MCFLIGEYLIVLIIESVKPSYFFKYFFKQELTFVVKGTT